MICPREFLVTRTGLVKLTERFNTLKDHRAQTVQDIEIAVAQGDLSENAEYHSAKNKLMTLDSQLSVLEPFLSQCEVCPIPPDKSIVRFGAHVLTYNFMTNKDVYFIIANSIESSINDAVVGLDSPIGQVILGKKINDEFTIILDNGAHKYKIKTIDYVE